MSVSPIVTAPAATGGNAPPAAMDRLNRSWYVTIPLALDPISPRAADAFSDGTWTAAWRATGALLPPIAFALGFLAPFVWPGMTQVFSESLVFLIIMIALSLLSGPAGVMLLLGYAFGDVLHDLFAHRMYGMFIGRQLAADVVSYLLMAVAVVMIPQASRRLASELSAKIRDDYFSEAAQVSISAIAAALLIFLWCQATIVLIRPVFTWVNSSPTTEAVMHVQRRWFVLVAAGIAALLIRAVLELIAKRSSSWPVVNDMQEQRWSAPQRRSAAWRKMPLSLRVLASAVVVTLLLAGTYVRWFDAAAVFVAVVILKAWRSGLLGAMPRGWISVVTKIPALFRFALAPTIGYFAGWTIIALFWRAGSLRPVMFGAFFTLIVFHLLFPATGTRRTEEAS
ncbi:MAG: hypothetical protein ACXW3E_13160 [Thermoanaerobaculia bacterium]